MVETALSSLFLGGEEGGGRREGKRFCLIPNVQACLRVRLSRTYAFAPLAPQIWGELGATPPKLGGLGGQNDELCVSPVKYESSVIDNC